MPVRVVYTFQFVKVEDDERKCIPVAFETFELRIGQFEKAATVEDARQGVCDG